jgi:hypothetical protein
MPGIDEVIVKGAGPEGGGGDDNNKKFNIKNFKEQLLKDKRTRYAAIGVVGFVIGVPLLFKILGGGTTVQVQQGLTKQQVRQTVLQTLQPVISQLQKQNHGGQTTQASLTPAGGIAGTQSTKQNSSKTTKSSKTATKHSTSNQSPSLAQLLGLGQSGQTKQQTQHQTSSPPPPPTNGYTPPLSSPMGMELPTELKPIKPPEPKMVFMEMPMSRRRSNEFGLTEKKSGHRKYVYIPAGSIVAGELMYGFTAPESGVLPPVVIKITKPIWTANNWYMPFQECLIVTKAQYNISENLAQVGGEGSTFTCVLPNGRVIETPVDVAIGEDLTTSNGHYEVATIGLRGKEKWLTGKQLAEIAALYGLQGFANSLQNLQTNQEITSSGSEITTIKNGFAYSLAGGVGQATNGFIQFWLRQYNDKVPAIQVPPKKVFIVFVQGAKLNMSPYKEVLP